MVRLWVFVYVGGALQVNGEQCYESQRIPHKISIACTLGGRWDYLTYVTPSVTCVPSTSTVGSPCKAMKVEAM
jgi:hypothetical protein